MKLLALFLNKIELTEFLLSQNVDHKSVAQEIISSLGLKKICEL